MLLEGDIKKVEYYSNSSCDLFEPKSKEYRIRESDLPYELQVMYHRYFWENLCGSNTYLVAIPGLKEQYGILLVYEYGIDYNEYNVEMHSPAWNELMGEVYNDEVMRRLNFYRQVFDKAGVECQVYLGKYTGFEDCHELGFFIPYGKSMRDTFKMLHAVNAVVTDSLEDVAKDVAIIKSEEMFRRYMFNTKIFKGYASKVFGVQSEDTTDAQASEEVSTKDVSSTYTILLSDKETMEMFGIELPQELGGKKILANIEEMLKIIHKIKSKAHQACETYSFSEIVAWAIEELTMEIYDKDTINIKFPKKRRLKIEYGEVTAEVLKEV